MTLMKMCVCERERERESERERERERDALELTWKKLLGTTLARRAQWASFETVQKLALRRLGIAFVMHDNSNQSSLIQKTSTVLNSYKQRGLYCTDSTKIYT